jgi:hypothetical protein
VITEHVVKRDTSLLTVGRFLPTKISAHLIRKAQTTQKQLTLQLTAILLCIIVTIVMRMETLRITVIKKRDMKGGNKGEKKQVLCVYETA